MKIEKPGTTVPTAAVIRSLVVMSLLLLSGLLFSSAFASHRTEDSGQPPEGVKVPMENAETFQTEASVGLPEKRESKDYRSTARLMASLTVFVLAIFVGFEVITKVPPTLHTPLMSGSNAISGITVVGALLAAGHSQGGFGSFLGLVAVLLASINVFGGFLVTHRMLMMFKKR
jgi:NAD(P) transhydrogenase subunit alpha